MDDFLIGTKEFCDAFNVGSKTPWKTFNDNPSIFSPVKFGKSIYVSAESIAKYRTEKGLKTTLTEKSIVAFYNRKGGVGKTTLLTNVAAKACREGWKILVIDLDSQSNATRSYGVENPKEVDTFYNVFMGECNPTQAIKEIRPTLHVMPANNKLATLSEQMDKMNGYRQFRPIFDELRALYDIILVDCGGIVDFMTFCALACVDQIVSPAFPDAYSEEGLEHTESEIKKLEKQGITPKHIVVCNRINEQEKASKLYMGLYTQLYNDKVSSTVVRRSQDLTNALNEGKSIFEFNIMSPVAADIANLYRELFLEESTKQ